MTLDERHRLLAEINPRLEKIHSIHESGWILDEVRRRHLPTPEARREAALEMVGRREKHEPLAYIFGHWSFRAHEFSVGPGALIPRPETEELVEAALKTVESAESTSRQILEGAGFRVVDLGAGTGCLGLSFVADLLRDVHMETGASQVSRTFHLTLVERSPEARRWLEKNVEALRPLLHEAQVEIFPGSWNDWQGEKYDLLLSNPPYVDPQELPTLDPSVREYEPMEALFPDEGGAHGAYEDILRLSRVVLKPGGWIYCEMGPAQWNWIKPYAMSLGYLNDVRTLQDITRRPRFFCARRA